MVTDEDEARYDRLITLWKHGIHLWEVEGAFLEAMEVWERAVLQIPTVKFAIMVLDEEPDNNNNNNHENQNRLLPKRQSIQEQSAIYTKSAPYKSLVEGAVTAPLLLFLAGCFLDACNYSKARHYCRAAWTLAQLESDQTNTNVKDVSTTLRSCRIIDPHLILTEYMAAHEEDPNIDQPWKLSRQIAQEALQQQQHEHSSSEMSIINDNQEHGRPWRLRWNSPYQRPAFCYYPIRSVQNPLLSQQLPVCPRDLHPAWCRLLEQEYEMILDEFLQLCQPVRQGRYVPNAPSSTITARVNLPHHWPVVGDGSHRDGAGSHDGSVVTRVTPERKNDDNDNDTEAQEVAGDWREWVLFGSGSSNQTTAAPKTRAWIRRHIPEAVDLAEQGAGEVIFSVLAPNTHIRPHCASTNLRWTAHLGLVVVSDEPTCDDNAPPSSTVTQVELQQEQQEQQCIRVADKVYTWQPGKVLVFDDSYEHEVWNKSKDHIRAVLLLRFWHPAFCQTEERLDAIHQALAWKQQDEYRRYHPPHPPATT